MKVAFDSRPASVHRGIGRYCRCMLGALRSCGNGEVVETHRPRARQVDVFHSPWIEGALLRSPVPMVVTLHDLVPLKRRGEFLRSGLRFKMRYLAVQRAVRVIVPSEAVAADAQRHLGLSDDRVVVIPEAPAPGLTRRDPADVAAVRKRYALPESYLLWVGGLEHPDPRKRVASLAEAPRTMPLVLVGPAARWAHELENVIVTGSVPDEDLAAIYTGAHALVFPSDDEGFGLPPVEALACGTPVAVSDVPVLREVLGDRATFVSSGDLAGLVAAAEAARRPAPPPPPWTWEDAAAATWEVYERAAGTRGPAVP